MHTFPRLRFYGVAAWVHVPGDRHAVLTTYDPGLMAACTCTLALLSGPPVQVEEATRRHDDAEHTAMAVDAVQQAMQGLDSAEQHANATRAAAGQVGSWLNYACLSIMHGPVCNTCKRLQKPDWSSGLDLSTTVLAPSSWTTEQACLPPSVNLNLTAGMAATCSHQLVVHSAHQGDARRGQGLVPVVSCDDGAGLV